MGGRAGRPLYAVPVMKNLIAVSFSHPGRPAIFTDLSAHTGMDTVGLKSRVVPCSHCSFTNSPFSLRGVWQSPHIPMFSTRYLPRATFAPGVVWDFCCAASIDPKHKTAALTAKTVFVKGILPFGRMQNRANYSTSISCPE